jgi:iron-sulfur cluster assembly protein
MSEPIQENVVVDSLQVSEEAIKEIKRLLAVEQEPDLFLRLGVRPGGCSGVSYVMAFDNVKADGEVELEFDSVRVVMNAEAFGYLQGAVIEFNKEFAGGGFAINNPNAKRSCKCGTGHC